MSAALRQRRTAGAGGAEERMQVDPLPTVAAQSQKRKARGRRRRRCGFWCIVLAALLVAVLCIFGGRIFRMLRSQAARGYVHGWRTAPSLLEKAAALESDHTLDYHNTRCRFPYYPDSVRAMPHRKEFMRRFWLSTKRATLLPELGTRLWSCAGVAASKEAVIDAVRSAGQWVLHFAHSNRTEVEHHDHLEQVWDPADPLEAPFAEFRIPPSPHDIPAWWVPHNTSADGWDVALVPALSGHSPQIIAEPFYLVVLAGRVRLIAYTSGYAFTIHDDHVWGWHENSFELVRKSGNEGQMCIVETDQAVLLPPFHGYSYVALENSVLLRVPIDRKAGQSQ